MCGQSHWVRGYLEHFSLGPSIFHSHRVLSAPAPLANFYPEGKDYLVCFPPGTFSMQYVIVTQMLVLKIIILRELVLILGLYFFRIS